MNLPLHQILPGEPVPLYAQATDDSRSILASCRIGSNAARSTLRIHSLYPLAKLRVSERCPPNVKAVHPYGTSNLLFLVLGKDISKGKARESSTTQDSSSCYRIALWDDKQEEIQLELTFRDPVRNLVLRRDKLAAVLERRVVLFHLDLSSNDRAEAVVREGEYETVSNPLGALLSRMPCSPELTARHHHPGLASIATSNGSTLLAFPGRQVGHVQLIRLPRLRPPDEPLSPPAKLDARANSSTPPPYPIIHIFLAHSSPLRTLTLSSTGSLLCTSSNKGTLLRVFSTNGNKNLIRELRRGTDQADIWSIAFLHPDKGEMIACASDKRTVHVWKVGDLTLPPSVGSASASSSRTTNASGGKGKEKDTSKAFNLLKPYLPAYFSSQWSDLTWRIPHNASVTFQPSHVAALAEQDDVATCFFVRSPPASSSRERTAGAKPRKKKTSPGKGFEEPFYLLVITRSGAWYKLSVSKPSAASSAESAKTSSTRKVSIQDDRENINPSSRSSTTRTKEEDDGKKCRMIEYRRIGYGTDGEEDEEEDNDDDDENFSSLEESDEE